MKLKSLCLLITISFIFNANEYFAQGQISLGAFYRDANYQGLAQNITVNVTSEGSFSQQVYSVLYGASSHYFGGGEIGDYNVYVSGLRLYNDGSGYYDYDYYDDNYMDECFPDVLGFCDEAIDNNVAWGTIDYHVMKKPPILYLEPWTCNIGSYYIPGEQFSGSFIIRNDGVANLYGNITPIISSGLTVNPTSYNLGKGQSVTVNFSGYAPNYVTGPDGFGQYIEITYNPCDIYGCPFGIVSILGRTIEGDPDPCILGRLVNSPEVIAFNNAFPKGKENLNSNKTQSREELILLHNKCKSIIEHYPELPNSVYALDMLWKISSDNRDDQYLGVKAIKSFLFKVITSKNHNDLYAKAKLLLASFESNDERICLLDQVIEESPKSLYAKIAYFQKISYFLNKLETNKASEILEKLDLNFPESDVTKYTHLLFERNSNKNSKFLSKNSNNIAKDNLLPKDFELFPNYPNPFNPSTSIKFSIPKNCQVKLAIYNSMGQLVKTLLNQEKEAGIYSVQWTGKDETEIQVASGIYFYKLETPDISLAHKMLLMK